MGWSERRRTPPLPGGECVAKGRARYGSRQALASTAYASHAQKQRRSRGQTRPGRALPRWDRSQSPLLPFLRLKAIETRTEARLSRLKTCVPSRLGNSLTLQAAVTCGASGGGQRWASLCKDNGRLSEVGKRPDIRLPPCAAAYGGRVTHRGVTSVTRRAVTSVTWPAHRKT